MRPVLRLPPELSIYTVREVRAQWLDWLAGPPAAGPDGPGRTELGRPEQVDGSAVAEIDAAGVQLLMSLAREIDAAGGALQLASPSSALAGACDVLGVLAYLTGKPAEANA